MCKMFVQILTRTNINVLWTDPCCSVGPPDAVLSCEFRTEKDQNPRIEWKKKGKAVTFVYFNNKFTSEWRQSFNGWPLQAEKKKNWCPAVALSITPSSLTETDSAF